MNNIIEYFIRSIPTVCMLIQQICCQRLLSLGTIILLLPTWFLRDFVDDVISSVCG